MTDPRALAARSLANLFDMDASLDHSLLPLKKHPQKSLIQALCFGVCRHYFTLKNCLSAFLSKPLKSKDRDIETLLLVGLYQLLFLNMAKPLVVSETVEATVALNKTWAKALVNGVLRAFLRQTSDPLMRFTDSTEHPPWLVESITKAFPNQAAEIFKQNNTRAPLTLRLNTEACTVSDFQALLQAENIEAEYRGDCAVALREPMSVNQIPGFLEGFVSVQDQAAQYAVPLLAVSKGMRVLDACAAPGGKLIHLLQAHPDLEFVQAVDHSQSRVERIRENIERAITEVACKITVANAEDTDKWWDGQLFDRILLDAPCSALGVIRRHPDIKLLRTPEAVVQVTKEQQALLQALWPLLKPGGILLYATCSILPIENDEQIQQFLAHTADAHVMPITLPFGLPTTFGLQILPGHHDMDGFYYAKLQKV